MRESKLNTILKNSLNKAGGQTHKIADPKGGTGIQNPYDGFGIFNDKPIYWEAKLIKDGLYSFNFNRIEDHQWRNLTYIEDSLSRSISGKFYNLVPVGFYAPRKLFIVIFFRFKTLLDLAEKGKSSFTQKDLKAFFERDKFLSIIREVDQKGVNRVQYVDRIDKLDEVLI